MERIVEKALEHRGLNYFSMTECEQNDTGVVVKLGGSYEYPEEYQGPFIIGNAELLKCAVEVIDEKEARMDDIYEKLSNI